MAQSKISIKYYPNKSAKPIKDKGKILYPTYMQVIFQGKNSRIKVVEGELPYPSISGPTFNDDSFYTEDIPLTNEELLKFAAKENKDFIHFNENVIKDIVKYESENSRGEFSFKGFGRRLLSYNRKIDKEIFNELKWLFREHCLEDKLSFKEFLHILKSDNDFQQDFVFFKNKYPNLSKNLGDNVKDIIVTHWVFSVFFNEFGKNIRLYDWLVYGQKNRFTQFLKKYEIENLLEANSDFIQYIAKSFPFDKNRIDKYLQIIGEFDMNTRRGGRIFYLS